MRVAIVAESDASFCDDGVEFFEAVEVLVDDGLVDVNPEGLCGLQLWRVGRQVNKADAVGDQQGRRVRRRGRE